MGLVYHSARALMKGALHLFGDWKVEGKEHTPLKGPLLVVANHQSNVDPPLLAASLPRRVYFLAKGGVFNNPLTSLFLKSYGVFPLNRDGSDLPAIQWALRMLKGNAALAIFPEGTRSPGAMRKAIPGIALIALRSGAPILPVGIVGSESIGPIWQVAFPRGEFRIKIGQPFQLPPVDGKVRKEQLDDLTTAIMEQVAALLPESYRGVYSLEKRASLAVDGARVAEEKGNK